MAEIFREIREAVRTDKLYRVAFFGASTVSQEWCFPSWPAIIRHVILEEMEDILGEGDWRKTEAWQLWNIQTVNFGMSGASSADLRQYAGRIEFLQHSDILFFVGSKNDAYLGLSVAESRRNLCHVIDSSLQRERRVVLLNNPPSIQDSVNQRIAPFVALDREVSRAYEKEKNFQFVDVHERLQDIDLGTIYTYVAQYDNPVAGIRKGEIDPIHYNARGSALVAGVVLEEVFGIGFNAERFLQDAQDETIQFPRYHA